MINRGYYFPVQTSSNVSGIAAALSAGPAILLEM